MTTFLALVLTTQSLAGTTFVDTVDRPCREAVAMSGGLGYDFTPLTSIFNGATVAWTQVEQGDFADASLAWSADLPHTNTPRITLGVHEQIWKFNPTYFIGDERNGAHRVTAGYWPWTVGSKSTALAVTQVYFRQNSCIYSETEIFFRDPALLEGENSDSLDSFVAPGSPPPTPGTGTPKGNVGVTIHEMGHIYGLGEASHSTVESEEPQTMTVSVPIATFDERYVGSAHSTMVMPTEAAEMYVWFGTTLNLTERDIAVIPYHTDTTLSSLAVNESWRAATESYYGAAWAYPQMINGTTANSFLLSPDGDGPTKLWAINNGAGTGQVEFSFFLVPPGYSENCDSAASLLIQQNLFYGKYELKRHVLPNLPAYSATEIGGNLRWEFPHEDEFPISPGDYRLCVLADFGDQYDESREDNNKAVSETYFEVLP
ncbi:MAG: hypothetical protein R3F61_02605 [Myxococcota bacterium]